MLAKWWGRFRASDRPASLPPDADSGGTVVVRECFSYQGIRNVLGSLLEQDLHAKRVNSLCDATLGVLHSGSLAICAIGQGLAAARSLKPKHAIKQVDRLLSNAAINVDDILVRWVPRGQGRQQTRANAGRCRYTLLLRTQCRPPPPEYLQAECTGSCGGWVAISLLLATKPARSSPEVKPEQSYYNTHNRAITNASTNVDSRDTPCNRPAAPLIWCHKFACAAAPPGQAARHRS
jgi:hypothetical protein